MSRHSKHLVPVITITALATPAYAAAASPGAGLLSAPQPAPVEISAPAAKPIATPTTPARKRHGRPSPRHVALKHYVFAGVVVATDPLKGTAVVRVLGGNHLTKPLVGRNTVFSLGSARLIVGDTNRDGKHDIRDIRAGDFVRVAAQLPANASSATQPYAAIRFADLGQPKPRPKAPNPAPGKPAH